MSAKVERDAGALADPAPGNALATGAVPPPAFDPDLEPGYRLPPEHPPWPRDAVSISARARTLLRELRPALIAMVSVWQHKVRAIVVGGRRVAVDATGSYRVD